MTGVRRPVRRLRPPREPVPRLADAVDAFLAQPDLAPSSRRSYAQTLGRLREALGADRPLDRLGARELERAAREAWGAGPTQTVTESSTSPFDAAAGFCPDARRP